MARTFRFAGWMKENTSLPTSIPTGCSFWSHRAGGSTSGVQELG